MKNDRFLLGILIGIVVLVAAALGMYFLRTANISYGPEDTPQGVVRNYLLAVEQGEYSRAYGYLSEQKNKPTEADFQWFLSSNTQAGSYASLQLQESRPVNDEIYINAVVVHAGSGPFDTGWREPTVLHLVQEQSAWKIVQMPYPYFDYSWTEDYPNK